MLDRVLRKGRVVPIIVLMIRIFIDASLTFHVQLISELKRTNAVQFVWMGCSGEGECCLFIHINMCSTFIQKKR